MANTIQDKLAYLEETKGLIKEAIIAKGVEVSDTDTFRSYANKIEAIQAGGGGTTNIPDGTKFAYSTFTTVPDSIIPYLEQQTDMSHMFYGCDSLTTVPHFDTSSVNNMSNTFYNCSSLQTVPHFDTSRCNDMSYMFNYCRALKTVPLFDTSRVTTMSFMFDNCEALKTVPHFDTSSVTKMDYLFDLCTSLTSVPQFDTSSVQNMNSTFQYCSSLQTVPLLNFSKVNSTRFTFGDCRALTNIGGLTGLKVSLDLSNSSKLTVDSVMNVINNAADMTSSPKTLTLHKNTFNKLSKEQIATATAKGWNIAHW